MAPHSTAPRRLALGVAAATAALALAGCSPTPAADPDAPVTITFDVQTADPKNNSPEIWASIQAFMEENPNITVEFTGQATEEHVKKIQLAGQTDTLPDIFWVLDADAKELAAAGKLVDVKPVLEAADVLQYYPETTVAGFSDGDVMYGQPSSQLVTGIWYNKAIFEDNGLDVPVTFDDLLDVVDVLSAKGITTISNGANQATFSCWGFLRDLSAFGWDDKVAGLLDGSEKYNNPDFAKLYDHIAELRDRGAFADNVATTTYDQIVSRFTSGEAAMIDGGLWMAGPIQDAGIDAGFWIGPEFSDGIGDQKISMSVPAAPFAYSAKSAQDPNKKAAMEKWMVFWAGQEAAQILADTSLSPATTWDVTISDDQPVFKDAIAAAFAEGTHAPANQPDLMVPTSVGTAMYDSIYGVILGQFTPDEAMDHVQEALDAL